MGQLPDHPPHQVRAGAGELPEQMVEAAGFVFPPAHVGGDISFDHCGGVGVNPLPGDRGEPLPRVNGQELLHDIMGERPAFGRVEIGRLPPFGTQAVPAEISETAAVVGFYLAGGEPHVPAEKRPG